MESVGAIGRPVLLFGEGVLAISPRAGDAGRRAYEDFAMATKSIKQAYFGFLLSVFAAGRLKDRARPLSDYAVANIILAAMLLVFFLVSIEYLLRLLIPELEEIHTPSALYCLFVGGWLLLI